MSRRLPPLNSLRAFEAAARHLSFKRAADELHVTPAAISQQIKGLEELLGIRLFRRMPRALLLTDAAQAALPHLSFGFDRLVRGVEEMVATSGAGSITVSVAPSFGGSWLVPRLGRFQDLHPGIDVRVEASDRLTDFDRDDVDIAIRFGRGDYAGLSSVLIFSETAVPVCAPALLEGPKPLREPADLAHHTLLHMGRDGVGDTVPNWRMWLRAAKVEVPDPAAGPRFSHYSMVIPAAVAGQGVALSPRALAEQEIATGRLVEPFCQVDDFGNAGGQFAYYLVWPEALDGSPRVEAFRDWLIAEAGAAPYPTEETTAL